MRSAETSQIYQDLMRFKPDALSPNAWALKAGVSRTVWSDMRRHGNPSRRTLEKLLVAVGSSLAEFEALRIGGPAADFRGGSGLADRGTAPWAGQGLPPLPLVASSVAGEWGDPSKRIGLTELKPGSLLGRFARPASLSGDAAAYAMTIVGDSMWPRFRPGHRVAISPALPFSVGEDVLVKLTIRPDSEAIFVVMGELVRRTGAAVELRQFNPALTFEVPNTEIAAIERVVGELI